MSYYRGDMGLIRSRGGAMRGDPGFFSFLKGIASTAVGFIPGVGPIASKIIGGIPTGGGARAAASDVGAMVRSGAGHAIAIAKRHPVLTAAGAAGVAGVGALGAHHLMAGHAVPMHGGRRRHRMNACNPRALRRAIRRTHAFAKLAMKTIHLVHPKKKARFGGFRRKKKH